MTLDKRKKEILAVLRRHILLIEGFALFGCISLLMFSLFPAINVEIEKELGLNVFDLVLLGVVLSLGVILLSIIFIAVLYALSILLNPIFLAYDKACRWLSK